MFLTITDAAQKRIEKAENKHPGKLSFYYESKIGCECGNTGIFTLRLSDYEDKDMDGSLNTTIGQLPIQEWSLSYLDEEMTLDYKPEKNTLVLKGQSGLINPNVIVTDEDGKLVL